MFKVLFVCTGNICRSPTADGVMKNIVLKNNLSDFVFVDSAGTHSAHIAESPDHRSVDMAKQNDIDISNLKARQLVDDDFHEFDMIFAMDRGHISFMERTKPEGSKAEIKLFLDYARNCEEKDVPDPYYGYGDDGFRYVFDLIQNGCDGILQEIKEKVVK